MCESYMRPLKLNLSPEEFESLPRNASWRYRFADGVAWIDPAPVFRHARLDLNSFKPMPAGVCPVRELIEDDWRNLVPVFQRAFAPLEPFATLPATMRFHAADQTLLQTRAGGDGPLIAQASYTALLGNEVAGAILVTLLPLADPERQTSYYWESPPPADCIEKKKGRPHLTWVFTDPGLGISGTGASLLSYAVVGLKNLGFSDLFSTFIVGNHVSTAWHWKCGFQPLAKKE
ncbi:MAG: hypothetical protein EXR99_10095 [Gemmataceae bacterium]|nr:hypothetical protein [Gemmataceae bacterium]